MRRYAQRRLSTALRRNRWKKYLRATRPLDAIAERPVDAGAEEVEEVEEVEEEWVTLRRDQVRDDPTWWRRLVNFFLHSHYSVGTSRRDA